MSIRRLLSKTAVILAAFGCLIGNSVASVQANPTGSPNRSLVNDVTLHEGGTVQGVVVNPNGVPVPETPVRAVWKGRVVVESQTDQSGRFQMPGLRGGVYQFQTAAGVTTARVWSRRAAPPSAGQELLIVDRGELVRGQGHHEAFMSALSHPWVIAGGVALAIALPLALDDTNSSP